MQLFFCDYRECNSTDKVSVMLVWNFNCNALNMLLLYTVPTVIVSYI
jgi:hypothetical protein